MKRKTRWFFAATLSSVLVVICSAEGCGSSDQPGGSCEKTPCFRANVCVETCGGPVKYSGCCNCPSGTTDRDTLKCGSLDASSDAPTDASKMDADCGTCFRPNECVQTCGGPVLYTTCCDCPMGTFDRFTNCATDASGG